MRFSPEGEGFENCRADIATWATDVIDPELGPMRLKGETDFKALISCDGCPLDGVEFPNAELSRVTRLQIEGYLENRCPEFLLSQMPQLDVATGDVQLSSEV